MEEQDGKFNAEIVDTFCFRWPAFRCYVLVRVLDTSVALFPIHSRRAFLYFHHAPLPHSPGPPQPTSFKRRESRIQNRFQPWKHTPVLADLKKEDGNADGDSNDKSDVDNVVSPRERHNSVTLADVLDEYYPQLKHGWIHAPCTAHPDAQNQTSLILESPQNILLLKARSPEEREAFLNLIKLQASTHKKPCNDSSGSEDDSLGCPRKITSSNQLLQFYLDDSRHIYECIRRLVQQAKQDEAKVRTYCELFEKLRADWDVLARSVNTFVLSDDGSQEQLRKTIEQQLRKTLDGYTHLSHRMYSLHERIEANPDAVGALRLRLMLDRVNCKGRCHWLYLLIGIGMLLFLFGAWYALGVI